MTSVRAKSVSEKRKVDNERLNAFLLPPVSVARLSPIALKRIFGVYGAHFPANVSRNEQLLMNFEQLYDQACAECGKWRIAVQRLADEFSPSLVDQLCREKPQKSEKKPKSSQKKVKSAPTLRETRHILQAPRFTSQIEGETGIVRRRVLVPITGGMSSLACVWWALNRPDFKVYLCYLVGVDRANVERELLAIVQLLRFARDSDGSPLVEMDVENTQSINMAMLRADPAARIKFLPMPLQPYLLESAASASGADSADSGGGGGASSRTKKKHCLKPLKHHPLTYVLMYRQILVAAQSLQCNDIVWGLYDTAREIVESLHQTFSKQIVSHQNWFPYETRLQTYDAFCEAIRVSDNVWKNCAEPLCNLSEPEASDATASAAAVMENRRKPKKSKKDSPVDDDQSLPGPALLNSSRVVQTALACIMPDAAQFVWSCSSSRKSPSAADATADKKLSKTASAKQNKDSADKQREEQEEEEKETAESTENYLKRRLKLLKTLNWCGSCCDCGPWSAVARQLSHSSNSKVCDSNSTAVDVDNAVARHNLIDAYTLLLNTAVTNKRSKITNNRKRKADTIRAQSRRVAAGESKKSGDGVVFQACLNGAKRRKGHTLSIDDVVGSDGQQSEDEDDDDEENEEVEGDEGSNDGQDSEESGSEQLDEDGDEEEEDDQEDDDDEEEEEEEDDDDQNEEGADEEANEEELYEEEEDFAANEDNYEDDMDDDNDNCDYE